MGREGQTARARGYLSLIDDCGATPNDKVTIAKPRTAVFRLNADAIGAMDAAYVVATESPLGVQDESSGKFQILIGEGNSGW